MLKRGNTLRKISWMALNVKKNEKEAGLLLTNLKKFRLNFSKLSSVPVLLEVH